MKTVKGRFECPGKPSSLRLDGYRSPSMWEKLEKWKAEKDNLKRKSAMKATSRQPFKVGSTLVRRGKVPAKASEKIKLLVESNQNTNWKSSISPRYSSCRKSVSNVKNSLWQQNPSVNQSVRKAGQARRETITLSAGKGTFSDKKAPSHLNSKENCPTNVNLFPKQRKKPKDRQLQNPSTQKAPEMSRPKRVPESKDTRGHDRGIGQKKALTDSKLCKDKLEGKGVTQSTRDQTVHMSEEETKLRLKLEQWLLANGKTPSQATRFVKTPRISKVKKQGQDSTSMSSCNNVLSVEEAMDTCKDLLREGCPPEYLSNWLDRLNAKLPCLQEMEAFVNCKSLVQFASSDAATTTHDLQINLNSQDHPEEDLAAVVNHRHRKSRRSSYQLLSPCEEAEESSTLKYQVREATPYFKRIHQALGQTSSTPSTMIVTPVRRSIRLSKRKSVSFAPKQNSELDICVDSLNELPCGQAVILRSNRALQEEFESVDEELDRSVTNIN